MTEQPVPAKALAPASLARTRSIERVLTFRRPFRLSAVEDALPSGRYTIVTEQELLEGASFTGWQRVRTLLFLPADAASGTAPQTVPINPIELAAAQAADAKESQPDDQTLSCSPADGDIALARSPNRSTLDNFQRRFYAAREISDRGDGSAARLGAAMNGDTLKELGREVAMGGVDAPPGFSAACEKAAAGPEGPTGVILWNVELTLDHGLGDSEIRMDEVTVS